MISLIEALQTPYLPKVSLGASDQPISSQALAFQSARRGYIFGYDWRLANLSDKLVLSRLQFLSFISSISSVTLFPPNLVESESSGYPLEFYPHTSGTIVLLEALSLADGAMFQLPR